MWSGRAVAFSPDGKHLAVGIHTGTVRLWDVANRQPVALFRGHTEPIRGVAFSPDGRLLAACTGEKSRIWEITSGWELAVLRRHSACMDTVAFAPDGRTLVSVSEKSAPKLWDVAAAKERITLQGDSGGGSVAYHPEGTLVAWTKGDSDDDLHYIGEIRLSDPQTAESLRGHSSRITAIAFTPDGKSLASASWDHTVKLWDVVTGQERATLRGHQDEVNAVAFSADGRLLVSAANDGTVRFWESVYPAK